MTPITQQIVEASNQIEFKQLPGNQWNEFSNLLEQSTKRLIGLRIGTMNLLQNIEFAKQYEIEIPFNISQFLDDGNVVASNINKLQTAVAYTQTMEAGTKQSALSGDFDIIAIEGQLPPAAIQAATVRITDSAGDGNLGVAPLLIIGTVAVVALVVGAITTVSVLNYQTEELDAALKQGQQSIEKSILAKPELIAPYTEFKAQTKQEENLALIDRIFGSGSGQSILSGVGGVLAALGIGYVVFKYMGKSRAKK